mmetsp:Transcript_9302/g.27405  ORF Transcript_9302/g.27405 Transcript_9302/m.27405 type:complete len:499 (+) Transcript_9302:91-1587(+)
MAFIWAIISLCAFVPPMVGVSVCVLASRRAATRREAHNTNSQELLSLKERLRTAQTADDKVRLRTTLGTMSSAWVIAVWVEAYTCPGVLESVGSSVLMMVIGGIFSVVYQLMFLLACRPLDAVGVRMVGLLLATNFTFNAIAPLPLVLEERQLWLEGEGCAGLRFAYASCRVAWHIIFAASALLAVMAPSPRRALLRLWLVLRVSFPTQLMLPTNHAFLWGGWGVCALTSDGTPNAWYLASPGAFAWSLTGTLCALLLTERNRGRILHAISRIGLSGESRRLAAVGTLLGASPCCPVDSRVDAAMEMFTAVPFSALNRDVFQSSTPTQQEQPAAKRVKLGEVDAFVSHCWGDDGNDKYAALLAWANQFREAHRREPLLWIDKCCINQGDIQRSLRGLPVYISGCKKLLVLAGPDYCCRLWCALELFCFLTLGGETGDITVLKPHVANLSRPAIGFKLSDAKCSLATDRDRILSTIEAAFGFQEVFNRVVCELMATCMV